MKKLSRLLATLLALAMLLPMFSGIALAEEPTELIFYFFGDEAEDDHLVLAEINKKLAEKLGVTMKVKYLPFGEVFTTYPLMFAGQTEMDAIFSSYWSGFASLAAKNAFMEITEEMLKENAPITWEHTPESVWDQARVNGKIYMVPQLMIQNLQGVAGIRGDLREKHGLAPVTDLASLEAYMAAIYEKEQGIVPMLFGSMGGYLSDILMTNLNEWAIDSNYTQLCMAYKITAEGNGLKPFCYLYTDEYRQYIETVYRWNQNGWISRDSLSNTQTNRENMANGRSAIMYDNAGTVNSANQDLKVAGTGAFVELTDLSGDAKLLRYQATGGGLSIPTNSKHPDKVLQVIEYLRNDKEMNWLVERGIQGEDAQWTFAGELNEDGTLNENVISYGKRASMYGSNWICWSAFRNWDYQVIESKEDSCVGYREAVEDMNDRSIDCLMQSFLFDNSQYLNELAAIQSVVDQYGSPLSLGFIDPATGIDEYIQMMEAAGLKKVVDAYCEQAAAYIEANK